jgi:hypothetical protein
MNHFLAQLEITFRRDPTNFRPRINKMDSMKVCFPDLVFNSPLCIGVWWVDAGTESSC